MSPTLPPLTGGYPVVAAVTHAGAHDTCGWAIIVSDDTGAEIIDEGVATLGDALNVELADKLLTHAVQREALIRVWRQTHVRAVIAAGGEDYLDVDANILSTDEAYLITSDRIRTAAADRAAARASSGYTGPALTPLTIATDGSRDRSGHGSWAWIDEDGHWDTGTARYASILQAELAGIAAAITAAPTERPVILICDSRDAIANAQRALAGEKAPETVTSAVVRVLTTIARAGAGRDIRIEWVKGHTAQPELSAATTLNDRADRLAVHARRFTDQGDQDGYARIAETIATLV
jgi:ribonuclease HI